MSPEQAQNLRELYYASRQAAREAFFASTPEAFAADNEATEAFMSALWDYTG